MNEVEFGQILGAGLMGLVALSLFLSLGGRGLYRTVQSAAIWALMFVVLVAGFGIWEDIQVNHIPRQAAFSDQGRVELDRHRDGHYYMTLDVNGVPVDFVVDTGASQIVLTKEDAERAGLILENLRFFGRAATANGEVRTAPIRLAEVAVGGIADNNVPAFVNEGDMFQSLLGMSYLNLWDKIEISDGRLILSRD